MATPGRADKPGRAITLACETYVYYLEAVEKFIGEEIKVEWADDSLYEEERVGPYHPVRKKVPSRRSTHPGVLTRSRKTNMRKRFQPKGSKA